MKVLVKFSIGLLLLFVFFWACLAVYFSYIDRSKSTFENHLSRYFARTVTINELETTWQGLSPKVIVSGFRVHPNDQELEAPMAFESLEASLSLASIFRFWPEFTEFSVEKPSIEIVSINADQLSIGGINFSFDGGAGRLKPKTVVRWLLDQNATNWNDGQIVWQRQSGQRVVYKDISFNFKRDQQNRSIVAGFTGTDDAVAFKAQSNGNLLSENDWDASFEILDGEGQPLVTQDDFSLFVSNGKGELNLKRLAVEKIQDFIALSGLATKAIWLSQTEVTGYLHDMALEFSGSLFAVKDWQLHAQASEFGFKSPSTGPSVNNLSGTVSASINGGQFLFSTQNAVFKWQHWFDKPFEIKAASGDFTWRPESSGAVSVSLKDGQFDDGNSQIKNINVQSFIKSNSRNISSFAELFTVDSVSELGYDDGKLVKQNGNVSTVSLDVDASADFSMANVALFSRYLPKLKKLTLLRDWWRQAFSKGVLSNGKISFQGPVASDALSSGQAIFRLTSDFQGVAVDYGKPQIWPTVDRGNGSFKIENDLFTLNSNDAYIGGDRISDLSLRIQALFKKNLVLNVDGKVTKSLADTLDFIFKGPLIAKEQQLLNPPIKAQRGKVDLALKVKIPLTDLNNTTVQGSALIKNAVALLPNDVPIEFANNTVNFTENSVSAKQIGARFLGGQVIGDLVTVTKDQPPVLRINVQGTAQMRQLQPWIGGQVLTLVNGVANWQGSLLINNSDISLQANSDMRGITVTAPSPLSKPANDRAPLSLFMKFGERPELSMTYADALSVDMLANSPAGSLFDKTLIRVVNDNRQLKRLKRAEFDQGINIDVQRDDINLDQWLETVIELSSYTPSSQINASPRSGLVNGTQSNQNATGSEFVDAMRSIKVEASNPVLLGRQFGAIDMKLTSSDGANWVGQINGDNIDGSMDLKPQENIYDLNLSRLTLVDVVPVDDQLPGIDYGLESSSYPNLSLLVDDFVIGEKKLGQLKMSGQPEGDAWILNQFDMQRNGVVTRSTGRWLNDKDLGSLSSFDFETSVDEAETALDDFSFNGFIKKGNGAITGNINWIGAPHEFDFSRLNGDFDLLVKNGELVKVEPGGGKILGLLNFNAVARRLALDFSDVLAEGLVFDSMQFKGQLSNGKAIMQEAYILSPAVFVRMEGQVDIAKETIDMEIHLSPELGGNLALLSGLANPAAGALVFLTQRVFKEQIRDANFTSYRALGTWEDFEIESLSTANKVSLEPKVGVKVESELNSLTDIIETATPFKTSADNSTLKSEN